ncbi:MAG: Na/Pi cotransporter family protein [Lautropia sp.]|nr:Na/Pi cotransporter family protein [Lautropia sp.]
MQTLLNLLSGVALLVWGTHIVRTGVLRVFGASLRHVLARSVGNRATAFLSGLGVTALVQSSSATALIASSFVGQGLIKLGPALVIMLGADLGTALMAMVFSLDLRWLSPLLIIGGVIAFLPRKNSRAGQVGRVALGLGVIILALQLVMLATQPMRNAQGVQVLFASLSGDILLDMLIGVVFTLLSWSSLSVVLLTAALVASGLIAVPVALSLVLGANLGSGLLALLVNLRTPGAGRHVAVGNLFFKLAGCLIFGLALAPVAGVLADFDSQPHRQVLEFHILFNLTLGLLFVFLTDAVARLVSRWIPVPQLPVSQAEPRHLDSAALKTPAVALANAAREALRIGDTVEQMLHGMLRVIRTNDSALVAGIVNLEEDVDRLYTAVKLYLTQISREALDEKEGARWSEIMQLTINLEHVGDILESIIRDLRDKKIAHRLMFSDPGMREIEELHAKLITNLRLGLSVFLSGDLKSAQMLLAEKESFRDLERVFAGTHLDRLSGQSLRSIETSSLHLDIISDMRRINSFFCSTAYPILEQAGQLRRSRLRGESTITRS